MQPLNQTSLFLSHYISSFYIAFHLLFLLNFAFFVFLRERISLTEIYFPTCQFFSTTIPAYISLKIILN